MRSLIITNQIFMSVHHAELPDVSRSVFVMRLLVPAVTLATAAAWIASATQLTAPKAIYCYACGSVMVPAARSGVERERDIHAVTVNEKIFITDSPSILRVEHELSR